MTNLTSTRKVTQEQTDAATRWTDNTNRKVFYLVESQSEPGTYYRVQWNAEYRVLQCLPHNGRPCPAAEAGKHCWHLDAALAAEIEFQAERHKAIRIEQECVEVTAEYQQEQVEHSLYTAQLNAAQERNSTTQCADGSWW